MPNYFQGKFSPKYPKKYVGDATNIIFRSGWERKVMIWLDNNTSVLNWASEEHVIPYVSPLDNKYHKYYVDFSVLWIDKDGKKKRALIEVKPMKQVNAPVSPKRKTKRYITEVTTYMVNQAKWSAAKEWCEKNNFQFIILTENEIKP